VCRADAIAEGTIMIAHELEVSLKLAFAEAKKQRHEFITVEHLLLALLDNPNAAGALRASAVNIDDLRQALTSFIADNTPQVEGADEVAVQPTRGFQSVIQRAIAHVQATGGSGWKEVTGANVLAAIYGEKDSHAVYYLQKYSVSPAETLLLQLEQSLLNPQTRTPDTAASLLADDFVEFSASGQRHARADVLALLQSAPPERIEASDFQVRFLTPQAALLTYVTVKNGNATSRCLRSSLWRQRDGNWQLAFHQGTRCAQSELE